MAPKLTEEDTAHPAQKGETLDIGLLPLHSLSKKPKAYQRPSMQAANPKTIRLQVFGDLSSASRLDCPVLVLETKGTSSTNLRCEHHPCQSKITQDLNRGMNIHDSLNFQSPFFPAFLLHHPNGRHLQMRLSHLSLQLPRRFLRRRGDRQCNL